MSTSALDFKERKQQMFAAVDALSAISSQASESRENAASIGNENFVTPKKATASRRTHSRLPVVKSTSVFDRLYKTQTTASRNHIVASQARLKPSTRAKLPSKIVSVDAELLNLSKLSISKSKKVSTPHKIRLESTGGKSFSPPSFMTPPPGKKRYSTAPYSAPAKSNLSNKGTPVGPKSGKKVYEFSPRMKPRTKLYFLSKFHPGTDCEPVQPISLGYTFFQTFCEYETGEIGCEQIAKEIFIAFFKKDFAKNIRYWKVHEPSLRMKPKSSSRKGRRAGTVYTLTMNATYSWNNSYRVAHTKGSVRFTGKDDKEIWVENFAYNVSGDP